MTDGPLFTLDADQHWDLAFDAQQWMIRRRKLKLKVSTGDSKAGHSPIYRWEPNGMWAARNARCTSTSRASAARHFQRRIGPG